MTNCSKRTVIALMLTIAAAFAAPAAAQDLSFGYQMQRFTSEGDGMNVPFGVNVSIAGAGTLTPVGQFDWSRKQESASIEGTSIGGTASFTGFAGGLRWRGGANSSATPFVEALFGVLRSSGSANVAGINVGAASETDPMLQFGAGVSVPVAGSFGVFGQFDYRRIFADGIGVNGVRFVAGIRLTAQ